MRLSGDTNVGIGPLPLTTMFVQRWQERLWRPEGARGYRRGEAAIFGPPVRDHELDS